MDNEPTTEYDLSPERNGWEIVWMVFLILFGIPPLYCGMTFLQRIVPDIGESIDGGWSIMAIGAAISPIITLVLELAILFRLLKTVSVRVSNRVVLGTIREGTGEFHERAGQPNHLRSRLSQAIVFWYPILMAFYLLFFSGHLVIGDSIGLKFIPLPIYITLHLTIYWTLLIVAPIFYLLLFIGRARPIYRVALFFFAIPFCYMLLVVQSDTPERLLQSASMDDSRFHVTGKGSFGDSWVVIYGYSCNRLNLNCTEVFSIEDCCFDRWALVVKPTQDTVYVQRRYPGGTDTYEILGTIDPSPYQFVENAQLENVNYWLYQPANALDRKYRVLICTSPVVKCTESYMFELDYQYIDASGWYLDANEHLNRIELRIDEELVFTIGDEATCYTDQCTILDE